MYFEESSKLKKKLDSNGSVFTTIGLRFANDFFKTSKTLKETSMLINSYKNLYFKIRGPST